MVYSVNYLFLGSGSLILFVLVFSGIASEHNKRSEWRLCLC